MAVAQAQDEGGLVVEASLPTGRWRMRLLVGAGTLGIAGALAIGLVVAGSSEGSDARPTARNGGLDGPTPAPGGSAQGALVTDDPLVVRFGTVHEFASADDPLVLRFGTAEKPADGDDPLVVRFGR